MDGEREQVGDPPSQQHADHFSTVARSGAGRAAASALGTSRRRASLLRTIEREVVPRLVLSHRVAQPESVAADALPADVAHLVALVLAEDADAPSAFVAERHRGGVPVESLYLDLLAPAARELGRLWEEDFADFTQVTIGLGCLHNILRGLSATARTEPPNWDLARHVLLVPAPGEQHTFGLTMVTEFFRQAGWTVWSGAPDRVEELLAIVRQEWFAVVGFSLACGTRLDALAGAIRRVRRASRNRSLGVMVGGPMFVAHPELVAMVGADATATDGRHAVQQARALLDLLAGSS